MPDPDIFISYNREDAEIAQAFRDALASEGYAVWWDASLRSGETYDEVTEAALRAAKAVVVLWSPRSVASRWVRSEATIADRNKTLLPVTIEPCERPVMFELTQTADLSRWRGDGYDLAWRAFVGEVGKQVGREPLKKPIEQNTAAINCESGGPFIAVLPLTCRDAGTEIAILAEDLTDDVTRELTQNSLFRVIAAGTMRSWQSRATDYRAMRQELAAAYAVEGKLQTNGDDVRLTLQLIDTVTGGTIKATRLARDLDAVAAAPEDFAIAASAALSEEIELVELNRALAKSGTLSGWDHMLRALAYARNASADSTVRGTEEARGAIAALPDLGLAHAVLANILAVPAGAQGIEPTQDRRREIVAHAQRAMQLDGDNPAVVAQLMTSYAAIGEIESGSRMARRAVELNPNSPHLLFWLATAEAGLGRTAEAIAIINNYERMTRYDRHRYIAIWIRGMCHFIEGDLNDAMAALESSLAIHPDFAVALKWKAIATAHRGDNQVAISIIRRIKELEPETTLDQHVWQMVRLPKLGALCGEAVVTLRQLWEAATGNG